MESSYLERWLCKRILIITQVKSRIKEVQRYSKIEVCLSSNKFKDTLNIKFNQIICKRISEDKQPTSDWTFF